MDVGDLFNSEGEVSIEAVLALPIDRIRALGSVLRAVDQPLVMIRALHRRARITNLLESGKSQSDIARELGISRQRVSQIIKRGDLNYARHIRAFEGLVQIVETDYPHDQDGAVP
jgi:uncharacterized protein YerC